MANCKLFTPGRKNYHKRCFGSSAESFNDGSTKIISAPQASAWQHCSSCPSGAGCTAWSAGGGATWCGRRWLRDHPPSPSQPTSPSLRASILPMSSGTVSSSSTSSKFVQGVSDCFQTAVVFYFCTCSLFEGSIVHGFIRPNTGTGNDCLAVYPAETGNRNSSLV